MQEDNSKNKIQNTTSRTDKIELLPEHIIDQIKAGEVIERPATLIKELIENAIDAKATKISVHLVNNGMDLLSIEDNGIGMDFDDLPMAFCRHATSKISTFDDLYSLYSYGFRGEALASISSVSKMTCSSNKANSPMGVIKFNGGEEVSHHLDDVAQGKSGTSIFVKELFYNTPVRMKFLQSVTSEKNNLKKILNAFILTHPEIEFSIRWDQGPKDFFPVVKEQELHKRVKKIFEKKKDPLSLLEFTSEYDEIEVHTIISLNSSRGNAGKFQYIFVNDRYVQDTAIHKIVLNSAQSLWPFAHTGNYIVFINLPADQLDVNVHPNKTVVKLFKPSKIYSLISSSIKQHIPKNTNPSQQYPSHYRQAEQAPTLPMQQGGSNLGFKDIQYKQASFEQGESSIQNYFDNLDQRSNVSSSLTHSFGEVSTEDGQVLHKTKDIFLLRENGKLIIGNTQKLICQYFIYLLQSNEDKSPSPLLVSEPLSLTNNIIDQHFDFFHSIGFEVDRLDEKTVVLRSFPRCMNDFPFSNFISLLINKVISGKIEVNDILNKKWNDVLDSYSFEFVPNDGLLNKVLRSLSINTLYENQTLKILRDEDLKKLL